MASKLQGRKIAFIGASGQLGKPTIEALINLGVHTITAIQRPEATSTFPAGVIVEKGNLDDESFLNGVLKGQDAVVLMPPLPQLIALQEPAIRVAAKVGVPYVFPSEFGPDPFAGQLIEENGLLVAKKSIRDLIEKLGVSSWVSVTVGPWLDAGLIQGLWGIDPKARKATLWQGADAKANTATIAHTGEALAAVLSLPEADLAKYKNKAVYTPSFHLTQREILNAVQRATGTKDADWDITSRDVKEVAKEYEEKIKEGDGVAPYIKFFVTHFLKGHGGDFENKVNAADLERLEQLGLHKENLEDAIKTALQ
ncbi:putative oxidoreductase CipA-like protein [Stipitochalara longipes BDJ]|nr:putative oxidoreductase CipA-like protein [Stipitochalara longipes BDJ]